MVNNPRRTLWIPPPLPLPAGELARPIEGPRYDLKSVKVLARPDRILPVTTSCSDDLAELEWDYEDVAALIAALRPEDFSASEWCYTSNRLAIDADAYALTYNPVSGTRDSPGSVHFYVKFGFRNNDPRLQLLLISCHESREPDDAP